jgi:hypothetical protein
VSEAKMRPDLPPIAKTAERMLLEVEQAVRGFPRYHRYASGADLRAAAKKVLQLTHRAWRDRGNQAHWVHELVWAVDELRLALQIGKQLQAFRSFKEFEQLIRTAEELGRQVGGWKKQQHAKGQNPAPPAVAPERAQTLSARAASTFEAHP